LLIYNSYRNFFQSTKCLPFNSFLGDFQRECVPHSLTLLTNMIIRGRDIQDQNKGTVI
uniref:Uncharacterized protein n=1 Tax=Amphimedon queenslandica TaxID=400682 RepID=A0A1X7VYB0_AMPQE